MTVVLMLLAGGLGGLCRYAVVLAVQRRVDPRHPLGTWVVNLAGAAGMGAVVATGPSEAVLSILGTGFLGGFTTFSTWMVESIGLSEGDRGSLALASVNLVGMAAAGLGAAAIAHGLVS
ncbi:MAG: CrcB family protein [Nitriliruptorales bacterium]|nr:CrcB family protein [Nitriliruptorales bacterium]